MRVWDLAAGWAMATGASTDTSPVAKAGRATSPTARAERPEAKEELVVVAMEPVAETEAEAEAEGKLTTVYRSRTCQI